MYSFGPIVLSFKPLEARYQFAEPFRSLITSGLTLGALDGPCSHQNYVGPQ